MSKILVAGVIWFSLGLLMCTYTAPLFTDVARGAAVSYTHLDVYKRQILLRIYVF